MAEDSNRVATAYWVSFHLLLLQLLANILVGLGFWLWAPAPVYGSFARELNGIAIALLYMLMILVLIFGAYKGRYLWLWLALAAILPLQALLAFFGYILPVGQISFWAATLGLPTGIFFGGFAILPCLAVFAVHWGQLRHAPVGDDRSSALYHGRGYSALGRGVAILSLVGFCATILFDYWAVLQFDWSGPETPRQLPATLGGQQTINPLATPPRILPDWHAMPFYSVLRSVPYKELSQIAMMLSLILPLFLPWLDRGQNGPVWRRPAFAIWLACIVLCMIAMAIVGAFFLNGTIEILGWITTGLYFGLFLVALPLITRTKRQSAGA